MAAMVVRVKTMATYSGWIEKELTGRQILFIGILVVVYIRDTSTCCQENRKKKVRHNDIKGMNIYLFLFSLVPVTGSRWRAHCKVVEFQTSSRGHPDPRLWPFMFIAMWVCLNDGFGPYMVGYVL